MPQPRSNNNSGGKDDFCIDEFLLEKEWLKQPKMARKYNRKLAVLQDELAALELELELTKARLAKAIRDDPSQFDIVGRITNFAVETAILGADEYIAKLKEVNAAKYKVGLAKADTIAVEHRKRALENLVSLFGMDYFSLPRQPYKKGAKDRHRRPLVDD